MPNFEIDIVADDKRIVATEFQIHFLHALGSKLRDPSTGRDAASECDHVRVTVRDERLARFLAVAGDDIDDPFRQFMKSDLSKQQRGKRRVLGGFDNYGVAGCQRGRDLPGHQQQRIVPGHDADDDTVRFLHHEVHLVSLYRWNHAARFVAANLCVIIKARGYPFDFVHVFNEWFAALLRQERCEVALMLPYVSCDRVQQLALFHAGNETPVVLRFDRSHNCTIRVFTPRARHFVNSFFRCRILNRKSFAGKTCNKLAVNEHFAHGS